jgi:predicted DCC family thiol-disulfide oxidoreductase YuxK
MNDAETNPVTVYYDGACPLCRREIAFYRRRRGADAIRWRDVSAAADTPPAADLCREAALKRFHVRTADGRLVSGGRAFAEVWAALPGFRPMGRALRMRPLVWVLEAGYRLFLPLRPVLQRLAS